MANFLKELEEKKMKVVEEYYFQVRQTEKYWKRDNKVASFFQIEYRRYKTNKILTKKMFIKKKRVEIK